VEDADTGGWQLQWVKLLRWTLLAAAKIHFELSVKNGEVDDSLLENIKR
jgi:hypothetical protein